jgi:symplekin
MERAAVEENNRRATLAAAAPDNRKRSSTEEESLDAKRQRLDQTGAAPSAGSLLASFDFTSLPSALITELVVANLQAFTEPELIALVQAYRQSRGITATQPQVPAVSEPPSQTESVPTPEPLAAVKEEPPNPLQMDIDEEELEYEPDRLNLEVSLQLLCIRALFSSQAAIWG